MTAKKKSTGRIIKATPKISANEGADDLEILNPNREIPIAGKVITVREYKFIEGLSVRVKAKPFIDDLYQWLKEKPLVLDVVIDLIAAHADEITPLIAQSADVDMDFINGLSDHDGAALTYLWWSVNGPFFVARVRDRIIGEMQEAMDRAKHAGQTSTSSSSQTE